MKTAAKVQRLSEAQQTIRRAHSIDEFALMYGISRASVLRAIKRGDLRSFTLGGRRLIPSSEVDRISQQGL